VASGEVRPVSTKHCYEAFADREHVLCRSVSNSITGAALTKLHWRSGTETPLVTSYGGIQKGISPDGRHLAYFGDADQSSLIIRDLSTGAEQGIAKVDAHSPIGANVIVGWPTNEEVILRVGFPYPAHVLVSTKSGSMRQLPGRWNDAARLESWPDVFVREPAVWAHLELWVLEPLVGRSPASRDRGKR
jgi:hypothetical protein